MNSVEFYFKLWLSALWLIPLKPGFKGVSESGGRFFLIRRFFKKTSIMEPYSDPLHRAILVEQHNHSHLFQLRLLVQQPQIDKVAHY